MELDDAARKELIEFPAVLRALLEAENPDFMTSEPTPTETPARPENLIPIGVPVDAATPPPYPEPMTIAS